MSLSSEIFRKMKWRIFPTLAYFFLVWTSSLGLCEELLKDSDAISQIKTTTGEIKGKIETVVDHEVVSFLGIPFAEPPIKSNRFKKPVPIKPWKGILDVTTKPPACMQAVNKDFDWIAKGKQEEDCLYLNVWVPRKFCTSVYFNVTTHQLPIMVWIHGGGFWAGSSNIETYDGAMLAAHTNVVVASMNYRVGSFGFLYSGTTEAPGNMGLYDQLLALKWIKDNAMSFCGSPDKITLFGESAGAISVGFHLISPESRKLFKRAIMESGSPYHPVLTLDHDILKFKNNQFAIALGCADEKSNLFTDPEKVVFCLRNIDAGILVTVESVVLENSTFSFLPTFGDDFLPKSAVDATNNKDFKETEVLIGNNKDEGAIFLNFLKPDIFAREHAPKLTIEQGRFLVESIFQQNLKPTAKEVADFYFSNLTDDDPEEILKAVHNSFGDFTFVCPGVFFAEQLSTKNDVYYYLFTHKPSKTPWGDWIAVGHYEEVPFVFGVPLKSKSYTNEECSFSHDIMQMWTTFARHGQPLLDDEWKTYANGEEYKELSPKSYNTRKRLRGSACDFWRKNFT